MGSWVDVYAASGITVGERIQIQSKSPTPVMVWVGSTAPSGVTQGYAIDTFGVGYLDEGEVGAFVYGNGPISVQVV